ncbi:MAG: hypothetical protein RLZ47_1192 [Bacteroidota bacterium]|jgi:nitrogen fixation/metabolism regulation signal transduction histidine kinase
MTLFFLDQHKWLLLIGMLSVTFLLVFVLFKFLKAKKLGDATEPINPPPAKWKNKMELMRLIEEYQESISSLKENTRKLAQQERETAWREMAKLVAHEIKNPLTPLKLGIQLLKKSWEAKDPDFDEKFERFTDSFIEQVEILSNIVSEFSNFAKMPEMVLEPIDLNELLKKLTAIYTSSNQIKIRFETAVKDPVWIKAGQNFLIRSFNNLINNAIEAIQEPSSGEIVIRLHREEHWAHVNIQDNGCGIPDEFRAQIFTPSFTTKTSGSGLGLAFVKQSILSIGGTIHFETCSGKGTNFYIRIPILKI